MTIGADLSRAAVRASNARRPRILVVDDEPTICAVVQRMLGNDEYDVATMTRSPDALERLQTEPFDLLITDISMPEINGLELAEGARQLQPLLGIVIMTGYGSFENVARAIRTGIADFIIKPFDLNQLRRAIDVALQRQQVQRDNVRLQTLIKVVEFGRTINSTLDRDELHAVIGSIVIDQIGATGMALLTSVSAPDLRQAYVRGWPAPLQPTADALAAAATEQHCTQTTQNIPPSVGAMLCAIPLLLGDEQLGVLLVVFGHVPSPTINELLEIVANQAALALRNARQYDTLRELDQLKTEFIAIASHELRTPLSLVLGYSSLLRNRLQGQDREALQQVITGALRIGDIVDDLMNLRRADTQQIELEAAPVDVWDVVREVVRELEPLAQAREVTLAAHIPPAPLLMVADRAKLTLALAHLIDNATKFTDAGGSVSVRAWTATQDRSLTAMIEVRDTGIGIARHDLLRIFERFYQVAPSTTRSQNGLGIGLTLTKILIELHGGRIQAQSDIGQGSVFLIHLPIEPFDT